MTENPRESVENTIPVLAVADVTASIRFYCEILDFKCDWVGSADPPLIASVSRDGHAIMLQCRNLPVPGCVWIGISDLRPLWRQIRLNGQIKVVQRPTNQTFALEMRIADPDGNILWFGTEPLMDVPFGYQPAEEDFDG